MLKIGITGGIGSGKTTVCKVFETLGVPVFYADDEARKILQSNNVVDLIKSFFGSSIVDENGKIDRLKLALEVFNDENKLKRLNSIIHPEVAKVFNAWVENHKESKYVIKEAAILFESGANKGLDKTVNVEAPLELRLERVMRRDNASEEKVLQRMKNQLSDEERKKLADYIIINDEKSAVLPQVIKLHEEFRGA
jgi:dephospho-CoA kinase